MKRSHILLAILLTLYTALLSAPALATDTLRIGLLKFGTVNWELQALQNLGLDKKYGFKLDITPLASPPATKIALKSDAVDVIVSDWFWVNLQRSKGDKLQLLPYSSSVGRLMVKNDSPIQSLQDLKGKRIGVAGGPLSKGWLLLQAAAEHQGFDLSKESTASFAAPPLLSEAVKRGQLEAAMTYWHYGARLESAGLRPLLSLNDIQKGLGMKSRIPMLGYVFKETFAVKHPQLIANFSQAIKETKASLSNSPGTWTALKPLMKLKSDNEFQYLREGYLDGTPEPISAQHLEDAKQFYELIRKASKEYANSQFDPDSFWQINER